MKRIICIIAIFFLISAFCARLYSQYLKNNQPFGFIGENLTLTGQVENFPEETNNLYKIVFSAQDVRQFGNSYPFKADILILTQNQSFHYGDLVEVTGTLAKPSQKYPHFDAFLKEPQITFSGENRGNVFLKNLFLFKQILVARFKEMYPEPIESLISGILLGLRGAIPKEITEDFRRTGLTHIIAISGYNIVILIAFVSAFLSYFPREISIFINIVFIALFTVLVGSSASVVRAAMMACLGMLAKFFGRKQFGLRSLFIAGYIMALFDPFVVFYDIGFQLSFGATAGLILFASKWQEKLKRIPDFLGAKESWISTTAAQIFTLPLIMVYFGGVSVIAPVANIVVLPFVPVLMFGGFLSLVFGKIVAAPTWALFKIILAVVHLLAGLPFSFFDLPNDFGIL